MNKPYKVKCKKCGLNSNISYYSLRSRYICGGCNGKRGGCWDAIKKIIVKRDKFCYICKAEKGLNRKLGVHHIDCNPKNNELGNLITMCNQCHTSIHNHYKNRLKKIKLDINIKEIRRGFFGNRLVYQSK